MLALKSFYFIRHGETDWNFERRCMGQQDIPLNNTGIQQVKQSSIFLSEKNIQTICYSPLMRATQTAKIINEILRCPLIAIENLQECCWGVLEGQLKDDGSNFKKWINGITVLGAETYTGFLERTLKGINESLSYPHPLIVSHGGVYWSLLKALGYNYEYHAGIPNATPIYCQCPKFENESWVIEILAKEPDPDPYEISAIIGETK